MPMAVVRIWRHVLGRSSLGGLLKAKFPRSFLKIPLLSQFIRITKLGLVLLCDAYKLR